MLLREIKQKLDPSADFYSVLLSSALNYEGLETILEAAQLVCICDDDYLNPRSPKCGTDVSQHKYFLFDFTSGTAAILKRLRKSSWWLSKLTHTFESFYIHLYCRCQAPSRGLQYLVIRENCRKIYGLAVKSLSNFTSSCFFRTQFNYSRFINYCYILER